MGRRKMSSSWAVAHLPPSVTYGFWGFGFWSWTSQGSTPDSGSDGPTFRYILTFLTVVCPLVNGSCLFTTCAKELRLKRCWRHLFVLLLWGLHESRCPKHLARCLAPILRDIRYVEASSTPSPCPCGLLCGFPFSGGVTTVGILEQKSP